LEPIVSDLLLETPENSTPTEKEVVSVMLFKEAKNLLQAGQQE
jgi:hypothetical protein